MATQHPNPRINITFEKETAGLLTHLARHNHQSVASLVRELALEALERREDLYFSKLADQINLETAKTYSHDEVWK